MRNKYGYHPPLLNYNPALPYYSEVVLALSENLSLVLSDALTLLQPDLNGGFQSSSEGQQNCF